LEPVLGLVEESMATRSVPILIALSSILSACVSTTVPPNLTAAATKATDTALLVHGVEGEILEARLLGLVDNESIAPSKSVPPGLVCKSSPSIELTAKELGAYADAINIVGKVSDKPKDTSYSGYLQQFKKNHEAIDAAAKSPDEESDKDKKETVDAQNRCMTLLSSDLDKHLSGPQITGNALLISALPAVVASIDGMAKSVLALIEQAQRDVAVRKSAEHMVEVLKEATAKLKESPGTGDYTLAGESDTRLGNTLAIHRWFAAQRLQEDWDRLHRINQAKETWLAWEAADKFVVDADAYVKLSANDPDKLLKQLQAALDQASTINDKTSLTEVFDSLSNMASALSGVDDKYKAFRKTID
jgi:hypothetical protein